MKLGFSSRIGETATTKSGPTHPLAEYLQICLHSILTQTTIIKHSTPLWPKTGGKVKLIHYGLLSNPILYISGYINQNRSDYYRLLREVSEKSDWHSFIKYMLEGFNMQARETRQDLQKVTILLQEIKERIKSEHKKLYSADLVEALFFYPVITPTKLASELGMHYTTTSRYLRSLSKAGILRETIAGKYHLFTNHKLLEILAK